MDLAIMQTIKEITDVIWFILRPIPTPKNISNTRAMDPELYRAAQSGNWEVIEEFADQFSSQTAAGNTALHVLAQFCDSSDGTKQILDKEPRLDLQTNKRHETPLHMAARKGHLNVLRALIDCAKSNDTLREMLGTRNIGGNTALHEAVRNNCFDAVNLLVEEAPPEFRYEENLAGESPLYIAVDKGHHEIAALILSACKSPSCLGPGEKTALHIAAAKNFPECVKLILDKLPYLTKQADKYGWNPLHYAAKLNHKEVVKLLLTTDKSMDHLTARTDDWKTALHVAVTHGNLDVIKEILLHCPYGWEMITDKFQNVLHLAVKNEHKEVLEFILENSWAAELINLKDVDGNTPLHIYVFTKNLDGYNLVNQSCADWNALNNAGLTPLDIIALDADKVTERESSIKDELVKAGATLGIGNVQTTEDEADIESGERENMETYMVVATLIVTVTFAAGFTVPGGYDSSKGNEGMAVLSKKAAFVAFVVSDSLALMFSIAAVLLQFMVKDKVPMLAKSDLLRNTKLYIALAMTLMVIAFLTGLYAVLPIRAIKIYLIVVASVVCLPIPLYLVFLAIQYSKAETDKLRFYSIV